MGVVVISLFDGMGCARLAIERTGIEIEKYYCSEIDKHAVNLTSKKFPDNIHIGSVTSVRYKDGVLYSENGQWEVPHVDYLLGGSPCQGFSAAGKGLNFEDPRSKLFFEYSRILEEVRSENKDVKFLLENVQMKIQHVQVITSYMGVEPITINSALVSAQNRVRLYWTNIALKKMGIFDDNLQCSIKQPEDKKIFLKYILQPEGDVDEKYYVSDDVLRKLFAWQDRNREAGNGFSVNIKNESEKSTTLSTGSMKLSSTLVQQGVVNDDGILRDTEKSQCLDANYFKGMDNHAQRSMVVSSYRQDTPTSIEKEKHPCLRAEAGGITKGIGIIIPNDVIKLDKSLNPKPNQDKAACQTVGGHSGGNHSDMDLLLIKSNEPFCARVTGRHLVDGKRKDGNGLPTEQQIEPRLAIKTGTLTTVQKDNTIIIPEATKKGFVEINDGECFDLTYPNSATPRGRKMEDKSNTLMSVKQDYMYYKNFKIRRLTPIECCRLQTVPDDYFFDSYGKQIVSDTQIYKMLGNGWTIDVISFILKHNL